ncbi:hypothetical protein GZ77_04060 [Endozoicomonas montiporae]|uniref:Uncharacterized protein n=2 Tax=Endozoicomonas montiporae TaxID=1027273 RepID=A0A081NBB3_9GAMM|nr:hypothetical protein EZMO1_1873 [Endozoicomonas montiporae CL-33]KEQ15736.1 hypothetical protein GZ77_04060 [Endozoicomonas montiporae]
MIKSLKPLLLKEVKGRHEVEGEAEALPKEVPEEVPKEVPKEVPGAVVAPKEKAAIKKALLFFITLEVIDTGRSRE